MRAQKASTPVKLAALAAGAVLVVLAVVVGGRLAGKRDEGPPATTLVKPPPEDRVVDVKEQVRHREFKEGKLVADIRGDTFFRGPDGRNHLKGAVEITNLGQGGEVLSKLTADEVVYDPATLLFNISGRVRVESGGVILEGGSFEYDKPNGLFGTKAGGGFSSKTMRGHSAGISYDERADEVRLGGGFRVEVATKGGTDRALAISGDSFVYEGRELRGRVQGRAALEGDEFRGAAAAASFVASQDELFLESAVFEGAAKVVLSGKGSSSKGIGEIRADRIAVSFARDPSGLSIETSGGSRLSFRPAADTAETVLAPAARLSFFSDIGYFTWSASGGIRAEITTAGGLSRTLEGEEAIFDGARTLEVSGGPGRAAVADSAEARIEASKILVAPDAESLLAAGGVVCVLKRGEGRRRVAFFSLEEDVAVSSERLEVRPEISSSFFTGNVLVSQGANTLRADEVEISGDAGSMRGKGGVLVTLTEAAAGATASRRIELGGEEMAYRPVDRTLTLTGKSFVRMPEARLEAGTVSAVPGREGEGVESLSAAMGVAVSKGSYVGRSEAAIYQAATERITLTGKPVLTDPEGGSIRGDRLTFDLADDKILVENEGQGRSTTVIKS